MCNNNDIPKTVKIEKIIKETPSMKTFIISDKLSSKPGQFVNIWLPNIDEKPMSISYQDNEKFAITVAKVGKFTKELHKLKPGNKIGIRGPYGNPFDLKNYKNIVLIGGGCGCAPVLFLADKAKERKIKHYLILGARTKDEIPFIDRITKTKLNAFYSTDDGSFGFHGFTTQVLERIINSKKIDCVYACGPEIMMKIILDICNKHNNDCQLSLERILKCSLGISGSCCMDPSGIMVCKEGPVLEKHTLNKLTEFGKYKRDATGKKINF